MTQQADKPDRKPNLQLRGGMTPAYRCSDCRYSTVATEDAQCVRCEQGEPRPDLSFIKEMARRGITIHQAAEI